MYGRIGDGSGGQLASSRPELNRTPVADNRRSGYPQQPTWITLHTGVPP